MFAEGELADIYKTDFIIIKEHGFSLSEIEKMMPFERDMYIAILMEYLTKKAKAIKQQGY